MSNTSSCKRPSSQLKRVPDSPHLKQYFEGEFDGLPLLKGVGPFVQQNLQTIRRVIGRSVAMNSRTYAVRIDLRFPRNYELSGLHDFSNLPLQKFFKLFAGRLSRRERTARHNADLAYVWSREYDKDETRPHFHVLILLNGHAYQNIGDYGSGGHNLYSMIEDSWLAGLGCKGLGLDNLVHVCQKGQYRLDRGEEDGIASLFKRVSYMAKVRDKNFKDDYHHFGGSQ